MKIRPGYCEAGPFAVAGTWRLTSRQATTELSTAALSRNQARAVVLLAIRPVEADLKYFADTISVFDKRKTFLQFCHDISLKNNLPCEITQEV